MLAWLNGWLQIALFLLAFAGYFLVLLPRSPKLLAERSRIQAGSKG